MEAYQTVHLPASVYDRVKDQTVRLEIDYSLTLMKLTGAYGIPAIDGDQRTPELGLCKTRINDERTVVQCVACSLAASQAAPPHSWKTRPQDNEIRRVRHAHPTTRPLSRDLWMP